MNGRIVYSAKECAYIAVFVALVIGIQLTLTFLPGIELVTALFVCYAFAMGCGRGMVAATAFSILRQTVFGVDLKVLVLYLVYYNALTFIFGLLGKKLKPTVQSAVWTALLASICTLVFTLFDNLLTPFWLGFTAREAKLYFYASMPFMIPQVICTVISVATLFLPLTKVFLWLRGSLKNSSRG